MNKSLKTLALLAAASALLAAGLISFDYFQTRDRFPSPTFIGTVNVSGLTEKEAVGKLSRFNVSTVYTPVITFEAENYRFTFSPEAVGVRINYKSSVRRAYAATHRAGYLEELR